MSLLRGNLHPRRAVETLTMRVKELMKWWQSARGPQISLMGRVWTAVLAEVHGDCPCVSSVSHLHCVSSVSHFTTTSEVLCAQSKGKSSKWTQMKNDYKWVMFKSWNNLCHSVWAHTTQGHSPWPGTSMETTSQAVDNGLIKTYQSGLNEFHAFHIHFMAHIPNYKLIFKIIETKPQCR